MREREDPFNVDEALDEFENEQEITLGSRVSRSARCRCVARPTMFRIYVVTARSATNGVSERPPKI